jgi:hypothetical protein
MENMEENKLNSEMPWKYGRKASRIVIRYGQYGRKVAAWRRRREGGGGLFRCNYD